MVLLLRHQLRNRQTFIIRIRKIHQIKKIKPIHRCPTVGLQPTALDYTLWQHTVLLVAITTTQILVVGFKFVVIISVRHSKTTTIDMYSDIKSHKHNYNSWAKYISRALSSITALAHFWKNQDFAECQLFARANF